MSGTQPRRPPRALPVPPPADLVEARTPWPDEDAVELERLVEHAEQLAATAGDAGGLRLATVAVGGAAAARLALDGRLDAAWVDQLVAWALEHGSDDPAEARTSLLLRVLLDVVAVAPGAERRRDALLRALLAFAPATGVRLEAGGGPVAVGEPVDEDEALAVAERELVLLAVPVPGAEARCRAYAEEVVRVLAADAPVPATAAGGADLGRLQAAERRLRRLALDLHDGPAQDAAALASDATLLEADLEGPLSPEALAAGRELAGEIRARLVALGRDIRDLAEVLEPRAILGAPLGDVLAREVEAFARRTGIAPRVELDEDLGAMTASQQIALARVAREALTNVADHADATHVTLAATASPEGVSLVVADDGCGFDVEAVETARAGGGLGLAGMRERVRMLGGRLELQSSPGAGTRIAVLVPRWRPSS